MASVINRGGVFYIKVRKLTGEGWERRRTDARTEPQAMRLALELEARRERQRAGLEPAEVSEHTLGELCRWWLKHKCPPRSLERETARLGKWVLKAPAVAGLRAPDLTGQKFERWFIKLEGQGIGASTINHLRSVLRAVFSRAAKAGMWNAPNPLALTEKRAESPRVQEPLTFEEVPAFLAEVPARWRALFAVAICTALRKSELFGLRRSSVDLERRSILVKHSYDYETTKGGHVDAIPLPDVVLPFIRQALEASQSAELVFPGPDGKTQDGDDAKLSTVVRRALRKAGLVRGYLHVCRRCKSKGAKHEEQHPDAEPRKCPACGMQLWPKAIDRELTFHGLRHTAATMMLRAGASIAHVQRILRHRDPKLTTTTYGHLQVEDMRGAINLPWGDLQPEQLGPVAAAAPAEAAAAVGAAALVVQEEAGACRGPPGVQASAGAQAGLEVEAKTARDSEGLQDAPRGIRTPGPRLRRPHPNSGQTLADAGNPLESLDGGPDGASRPSPSLADLGTFRGPPVVQAKKPKAGGRTALSLQPVRQLLTPLDVAELLQVSRATVYALVEAGELEAARVGGSIRIKPEAVAAYLARPTR